MNFRFLVQWLIQLGIILISFALVFWIQIFPLWIVWGGFGSVLLVGTLWVIPKVRKTVRLEEMEKRENNQHIPSIPILVATAQHNEGEAILQNLKRYLSYPLNLRCRVYDDASTDGSLEALKKLESACPGRLEILPLNQEGYQIHPQGIVWNQVFQEAPPGLILLIDADSRISCEDLCRGARILQSGTWDAIHYARRNTLSDGLSARIADTDETMQTCGKVLGLFPFHFLGSGILLQAEAAQGIQLEKKVFSQDSEILTINAGRLPQ